MKEYNINRAVEKINGMSPNPNGEITIDTGANNDLSNLSELGEKHFLNKSR